MGYFFPNSDLWMYVLIAIFSKYFCNFAIFLHLFSGLLSDDQFTANSVSVQDMQLLFLDETVVFRWKAVAVSVTACLHSSFVCLLWMCRAVILTCQFKGWVVLIFFKITVTSYFGGAPSLALGWEVSSYIPLYLAGMWIYTWRDGPCSWAPFPLLYASCFTSQECRRRCKRTAPSGSTTRLPVAATYLSKEYLNNEKADRTGPSKETFSCSV